MRGRPSGRPDKVQLIFDRRIIRSTPGQFRTRILTQGVVPTLHVDYKQSKIKQYHKEGQAPRTEITINVTYDFQVGRLLKNLGQLRQIGFNANRRLLNVQTLSHDCLIGEERFKQLTQPIQVDQQRVSALRFGDKRVLALMHALCQFTLIPEGLRHCDLRPVMAQLPGLELDQYSSVIPGTPNPYVSILPFFPVVNPVQTGRPQHKYGLFSNLFKNFYAEEVVS